MRNINFLTNLKNVKAPNLDGLKNQAEKVDNKVGPIFVKTIWTLFAIFMLMAIFQVDLSAQKIRKSKSQAGFKQIDILESGYDEQRKGVKVHIKSELNGEPMTFRYTACGCEGMNTIETVDKIVKLNYKWFTEPKFLPFKGIENYMVIKAKCRNVIFEIEDYDPEDYGVQAR